MSVITDLNTSSCVRSSERVNCSVCVWMRVREIARSVLRSLGYKTTVLNMPRFFMISSSRCLVDYLVNQDKHVKQKL